MLDNIIMRPVDWIACTVAAFIATTFESWIGATYQDNVSWLSNELVNLINTFVGAAVAIVWVCLWQGYF